VWADELNGKEHSKNFMETITQTERLTREEPSGGIAMHWIGGQWLDSGEHRESINPATGEMIGSYANGGRKEAELAVNAALPSNIMPVQLTKEMP